MCDAAAAATGFVATRVARGWRKTRRWYSILRGAADRPFRTAGSAEAAHDRIVRSDPYSLRRDWITRHTAWPRSGDIPIGKQRRGEGRGEDGSDDRRRVRRVHLGDARRVGPDGTNAEKPAATEMIAALSRGWPHHLHGAQAALCGEAIRTSGVLREVDTDRVRVESDNNRHSYYRGGLQRPILTKTPTRCSGRRCPDERPPSPEHRGIGKALPRTDVCLRVARSG